MDTTTTLIGLALLAICIIPFILLNRKRKKVEKRYKLALTEIAKRENCTLTKHEIDGDLCVGLDEQQKKLFFVNYHKDTSESTVVDLSAIESCSILKTQKEGMKDQGDSYSIASLAMQLKPIGSQQEHIILEFYNAAKKIQLGTEYILLREWSKIVNEQLKLANV